MYNIQDNNASLKTWMNKFSLFIINKLFKIWLY